MCKKTHIITIRKPQSAGYNRVQISERVFLRYFRGKLAAGGVHEKRTFFLHLTIFLNTALKADKNSFISHPLQLL
jgi:hypothetical protein